METQIAQCPNCGSKLKSSMLSFNSLIEDKKVRIINLYSEKKSVAYCSKCGNDQYNDAFNKLAIELGSLRQKIKDLLPIIPVISTHTPYGWNYDVLEMVTAQTVSGTGFMSEISSSVSDIFGTNSEALSNKLKGGENSCFAQLRKKALDLGGQAVIATDIDYSEIGSLKVMLMVCMAGTAIRLKNSEVLGEERVIQMNTLNDLNARLKILTPLSTSN